MPLFALLIGAILIVVAVKGSQDSLFGELKQDVPAFGVWAAAILALGVIGFVPGLKPVSRGLLALIVIVIVVNNYTAIMKGLKEGFTPGSSTASGGSKSNTAHGTSLSGILGDFQQGVDIASQFGVGG